MSKYAIGKEIAEILARLSALESRHLAVPSSHDDSDSAAALQKPEHALELISIEPLSLPPRITVDPFETFADGGKWLCDPKVINVLTIGGRNLPYRSLVLYKALEISWSPDPGSDPYTNPCPRQDVGGVFPQLKLHSLVFGLGARGVGCRGSFGIEGSPGSQVWVAVNDTSFSNNEGRIVVQVKWR